MNTGTIDPYSPPQANLNAAQEAVDDVKKDGRAKVLAVAEGQRYANLLIIVSMLFMGLVTANGTPSPLLVLPLQLGYFVIMALVVFRSMRALSGTGMAVAWAVISWVPLLNLIMLAMISSRATKLLRANGFTVGFLGADIAKVRTWARG